MGTLRPAWDHSPQTQAGHLTTKSSLVHPKDNGPCGLQDFEESPGLSPDTAVPTPVSFLRIIPHTGESSLTTALLYRLGFVPGWSVRGWKWGDRSPGYVFWHIQLSFTTTDFPSFPPCLSNQSWGKRNPAASWPFMITTAIKSVLWNLPSRNVLW